MPRPSVTVTIADATPAPGLPTDTGVAFIVGFTEDGAYDTAHKFTSFEQAKDTIGDRVAHGYVYDAIATMFSHGVHTVYFSRVGGPAKTVEDDDNENALDAHWATALTAFTGILGPGQVLAPGRTTAAAHAQLIDHGIDYNRRALLDFADTSTVATLTGVADTDAAVADSWVAAAFAPWVNVTDPDDASATRALPPSPVVAGLIARSDAAEGLAQPPAGRGGPGLPGSTGRGGTRVVSVRSTFTDAQWDTLADSNINLLVSDGNGVVLMGFDSVTSDDDYRQFTGARVAMGLVAELGTATSGHQFSRENGKGSALVAWAGALTSRCDVYYRRGDLYGATSAEAFDVDTGPLLNPLAQLAAGQGTAKVRFHPSPFLRDLDVTLQRHRIDQPLTAG